MEPARSHRGGSRATRAAHRRHRARVHDEELRRLRELVHAGDERARVRPELPQLRFDVARAPLDVAECLRVAGARAEPRGRAQLLQRGAQRVEVVLHLLRDDHLRVELRLTFEVDEDERGERDDRDHRDREPRGREPRPRQSRAHGPSAPARRIRARRRASRRSPPRRAPRKRSPPRTPTARSRCRARA